MNVRTGVLTLVITAGLVAGCTPSKVVPNAAILKRDDGQLVILVAPCEDYQITDVLLATGDDTATPASPGRWWIEAPREEGRSMRHRTVDGPVEVVPFRALADWTIEDDDLGSSLRPGVTYRAGGFMEGKHSHQATGPEFTLADLERLRPGEVHAAPKDKDGDPIVMSRADFEDRAADAC